MQGVFHGSVLIYLTANISANKINLPRTQGNTERKEISFVSRKSVNYTYN